MKNPGVTISVFGVVLVACLSAVRLIAQTGAATEAKQPQFDIASVKENKSDEVNGQSNIPMGPGTVFPATGGLFRATNVPLYAFISFAWKFQGTQDVVLRSQLPAWVFVARIDMEARSSANPTKDQMRLMMRSLLADRFKLAVHTETRDAPIFALVLAKAGKTGPRLQAHPKDSCQTDPAPRAEEMIGKLPTLFPALCGGLLPMPASAAGRQSFGGRDVTMGFLANQLAALGTGSGVSDRPFVDQTGLSGTFDFALEWARELSGPGAAGAGLSPDDASGPTFLEAVQEQLGLKLLSQRGPVGVMVLDHIEKLAEN